MGLRIRWIDSPAFIVESSTRAYNVFELSDEGLENTEKALKMMLAEVRKTKKGQYNELRRVITEEKKWDLRDPIGAIAGGPITRKKSSSKTRTTSKKSGSEGTRGRTKK